MGKTYTRMFQLIVSWSIEIDGRSKETALARSYLSCLTKKVAIVDAPKGATSSSMEENFGFWIDEATKIITLADGKKLCGTASPCGASNVLRRNCCCIGTWSKIETAPHFDVVDLGALNVRASSTSVRTP